ncbi:methyltransferase family protein [Galenea microaerophila]
MKINRKTAIRSPLLSRSLVFFQFLLATLLMLFMDWQRLTLATLLFMVAAIGLGLWGVWTMRKVGFNVIPDPHEACQLVDHGPYRWIRHPMYTSILLFFWPMVYTQPLTSIVWLLMLLLTVNMLLKLHYEERLLVDKIPCYRDYQQRTAKIVPFIF